MTSNALFLDVVAIPENMAVYASATKTIAFGMLPILFTVTAIEEQAKVIRNEQNDFPRLFYSTVAAFFTLVFFYSWFFTKIVALCEAIGLTMYSAYDWAAFQSMISDPAQELSKTGLWKMGLVAVLSGGIVFLSGIIEFVFELVRYSLLCLLYVLGPIAIVMGIYPKTTSMFKGWVINVAQISAWIIMLRILQGVLLAIGIDALNNPTFFKGAATGIVSLVYVILIVLVPVLAGKILSGENIGAVGSAAIGLVGAVGGFGAAGALAAQGGGIKGALKGAVQGGWHGFTHATKEHFPSGALKAAKNYLADRKQRSSEQKEKGEEREKRR